MFVLCWKCVLCYNWIYNNLSTLSLSLSLSPPSVLFSEYYFSDENLQKDFFLRGQVCTHRLLLLQLYYNVHVCTSNL